MGRFSTRNRDKLPQNITQHAFIPEKLSCSVAVDGSIGCLIPLQEISVKFLISLLSIPFWRDSIRFGETQFVLEGVMSFWRGLNSFWRDSIHFGETQLHCNLQVGILVRQVRMSARKTVRSKRHF